LPPFRRPRARDTGVKQDLLRSEFAIAWHARDKQARVVLAEHKWSGSTPEPICLRIKQDPWI